MANKKLLVTGAAGFIGSHLCDRFLKDDYHVIGVDNFLTGRPDNISHLSKNGDFEFIECDITNDISIDAKLDCVLHFACPASPVDYIKYPIQTLMVDSIGTFKTLDLARRTGARYIFASTSEIYGDPLTHPQSESYWGNVNTLGPRAVYDEAKRFSEAVVMEYHRTYGMDVRIARIFNTYGPRMRLDDGRVVPDFILQSLKGEDITIYGDGMQTRSFCYVDDMVEAVFKLSTTDRLRERVFNLGNPDEYRIIDFARIVKEVVNSGSKIVHRLLPTDDPRQRCPDISRVIAELDWRPKVDLNHGLGKTLEYFKLKI